MRVKYFLSLLFSLLFYFLPNQFLAQSGVENDIPPLKIEADGLPAKPSLSVQKTHSVYDYAQLLSPQQRRMLEQKLSKYYDSTSTQIVIATVHKVNDDIALYGTEWAHKWGIGQQGQDNGLLILISKDDHKITIRTGYGLEDRLTDALSKRIITRDIIPYFKKEQYFEGLNKAVDDIIKVLDGAYQNNLKPEKEGIPIWIIIIFIIIFFILVSRGAGDQNSGGWRSGGGPIIFSSGGRSSWSGGGSSWGGGGFSGGFGGGGFGGGGASGSW